MVLVPGELRLMENIDVIVTLASMKGNGAKSCAQRTFVLV